uniref:Uncharacterized protein n=1 Tax=Rhizophora mucronata TaxID=61149 RepID=A0A2P2R5E0_RHIMU
MCLPKNFCYLFTNGLCALKLNAFCHFLHSFLRKCPQ